MKSPKFLFITVCSVGLVAWVLLSVSLFSNKSVQIERDRINRTFFAVTQNNVNTANIIFTEFATTMTIASHAIEENTQYNDDAQLLTFLQEVTNTGKFLCVCFYSEGRSFNSHGHSGITFYENVGYEQLANSNVFVSNGYYDEYAKQGIVSLMVPLTGRLEGSYLVAKVSLLSLSKLFDHSFYTSGGYYHIVDENGVYVATSDSGEEMAMDISFYDAASVVNYEKGYSETRFLDDVAHKRAGVGEYSYEGNYRYMYYMPVGINDWIMTTVIPKETIASFAEEHQRITFYLVVSILTALGFVIALVFYNEKKNQSEVQLVYESIKSLAEKAHKVIIEWDYKTHVLTSLSDYKAMFGRDIILSDIRKEAKNQDVCHDDDLNIVTETLQRVTRGEMISNVRFRMKHANGNYLWCAFESTLIKSAKGELLKAFIFIENIDSYVRHAEQLKESAERDPLTGLYNKAQTEELIIYELDTLDDKISALFIVDYDNFKLVNDTFGHQKGDEVLKETSEGLKALFRSDDIIGRIGGDEFFVYIKNIANIDDVKKKAGALCKTLKKTYRSEEGQVVDITFSVGVALAPTHGKTFTALYDAADKALYTVKNSGKNNYLIYSKDD